MMENRLDQLSPGQSGVIARMAAEGQLRSRLMDMGLIKGTPVSLIYLEPAS
jgi:Fe2+ transport system protein FeoA